ncbi:MAG: hypothetical protein M3Z05_05825, partial [Gemmatimonadota bacterium]|nr:hypothetical protein [Gemmatimonadota bacterium]
MRNIAKHTSIALAMAMVAGTSAGAQGVGPRWQAWVGCWTSAAPGESYGSSQFAAPIVCVVPTSNADVVEVATIADGKVAKRDTIDASGMAKAIQTKDCQGSQVARWSADERRVYLSSASTCFGMKSTVSSILAMSDKGEWLDVRGVKANEGENVRVARYRDIGLPSSIPAEITDQLRGRSGAISGARVAAGANIGTTAVAEASKAADMSVVEAWLFERGQRFALNANTLVALADAGIPSRITDAMVAVSNPNAFELARAEPAARSAMSDDGEYRSGRRIPVYLDPYDPWGYGYSRYGYNRYGQYGYGSPYGYGSSYGGGYGYYGGYSGPIIIVTGSQSGGTANLSNPQSV